MNSQPATLNDIIAAIRPADTTWLEKAKARTQRLVMPTRALGRLHEITEKLCAIRSSLTPETGRKAVLIFAGDHGVVAEGVSAYPQEVTGAMIATFLSGGAAINAFCRHVNAEVNVVDMGIVAQLDLATLPKGGKGLWIHKLGAGTANFTKGPAMSRADAAKAVTIGFQLAGTLFDSGIDMLGTGDMGIGNTTASAAVGVALTGTGIADMVGRGTGVDDQGLGRKQEAVARALGVNRPDPHDALDVLAKVGGFEIGGIAGAVLAGAFYRRPVVIDGFISTAGALIAQGLCPHVTDYLFAGHCSEEKGHGAMLERLNLLPILDLGMRLGEGSGGALAMDIIAAAARMFTEMATFEEARVPDKG